ncbi:MAG: hypothetical protein IJH39_12195, partial [Clostridia bacterium]|nr:hypothetical protein [Clostridia bacterium]
MKNSIFIFIYINVNNIQYMKSLRKYILGKTNYLSEKEKNELAKKYEPLVHKIANKYKGYDNIELFDAGLYGLTLGILMYHRFDGSKGKELTWFAHYIDYAIKDYIRDKSRLVRLPASQTKEDFYKKQNNISLDNLLNKDSNYNNDELDTKENDDFKYRDKLKYIDSKYTDENIKFVNDTWNKIFKDIEDNFSKKSV